MFRQGQLEFSLQDGTKLEFPKSSGICHYLYGGLGLHNFATEQGECLK